MPEWNQILCVSKVWWMSAKGESTEYKMGELQEPYNAFWALQCSREEQG